MLKYSGKLRALMWALMIKIRSAEAGGNQPAPCTYGEVWKMGEKFNQQKYINGFVREYYDSITFRVRKEENFPERLKKAAEKNGTSKKTFIVKTLEEAIKKSGVE